MSHAFKRRKSGSDFGVSKITVTCYHSNSFFAICEVCRSREGSVPDLGLGTLGTCPGASTRNGLHKSRHVLLDFGVCAASRTRSKVLAH